MRIIFGSALHYYIIFLVLSLVLLQLLNNREISVSLCLLVINSSYTILFL